MSRFFDHNAYSPYEEICAAGKNAAVLHYKTNRSDLVDGEMLLLDAGVKLNYYCSDITTTIPINGKFNERQKNIYNLVLETNRMAIRQIRVGVNWQELQIAAEKNILRGLVLLGLLNDEDIDEMWQNRVIYYFFPHGLGHYIGVYTHDIPGNPHLENEARPIKKMNLRVKRRLEAGMCLTVEPGIYFIDNLLDEARRSDDVKDYFNWEVVGGYAQDVTGGVRIEDMIHVTHSGAEILTDHLPRTVEEIEGVMAGGQWTGGSSQK